MRRRQLVGSLVGIVMLACPPVAGAQEGDGGVTIDPNSPSGKEYEIPLESARRGAEPGRNPGAPVQQGQRGAPLFGAGITSGDQAVKSGSKKIGSAMRGGSDMRRPAASSSTVDTGAKETGPPEVVRVAAANPGAPGGGPASTVLVIAAATLVLALGAGAGIALRRRD